MIAIVVALLGGGLVGWMLHAYVAERDEFARGQARDDEWDTTWLSR